MEAKRYHQTKQFPEFIRNVLFLFSFCSLVLTLAIVYAGRESQRTIFVLGFGGILYSFFMFIVAIIVKRVVEKNYYEIDDTRIALIGSRFTQELSMQELTDLTINEDMNGNIVSIELNKGLRGFAIRFVNGVNEIVDHITSCKNDLKINRRTTTWDLQRIWNIALTLCASITLLLCVYLLTNPHLIQTLIRFAENF